MPIQHFRCPAARRLALLAAFLIAPLASPARAGEATPPPLAAITVGSRMDAAAYQAEARVEAVRQAALAVPVAGAVTELKVLAGDRVAAGQMLLQVEGKAAADQAAAAHAQIAAAEAQRVQARQEYARAKALAAQKFLSAAALDQAEAKFRSAEAQARAQIASAGAAAAQAGLYRLTAPFAGWVSQVDTERGDVAVPGKPLLTVYDPSALRVTATVPATVAERVRRDALPEIAIAPDGAAPLRLTPSKVTWLPSTDPLAQTRTVRLDLPAGADVQRLPPGTFARAAFPLAAGKAEAAPLTVPAKALVRRGELTAVYVLDTAQRPRLRYVRPGVALADGSVPILAGLKAGERVALEPEAATRQAPAGTPR